MSESATVLEGGTHETIVDGGIHGTTALATVHYTTIGDGPQSITLLSSTNTTIVESGGGHATTLTGAQSVTVLDTGIGPRGPEGPAGVLNLVVEANCLAGDAVDDCVTITGPSVAGKYQVTKADPTDAAKMPAVGMIVSKSSATECFVMLAGVFPVGGLTPGKLHFVGTSGTLTATRPSPGGSPVLVQPMGIAIDTTKLALLPSSHITRLNP